MEPKHSLTPLTFSLVSSHQACCSRHTIGAFTANHTHANGHTRARIANAEKASGPDNVHTVTSADVTGSFVLLVSSCGRRNHAGTHVSREANAIGRELVGCGQSSSTCSSLMETHELVGKSCSMGTRNCRQPFQCPISSIRQMRLKMRMNMPAMLRN